MKYLKNLWRAVDNLINALFAGNPRESVSSRLGREDPNGVLSKLFNVIEPNHCLKAWEKERKVVEATYE